MIERVRRQLRGEIAQGAMGTFGLKGFQTGIMLLVSLSLARLLGPDGYGAYSFAMSWVNILVVPAMLGLQPLLVRNLAAYQIKDEWRLMRGLLRRMNQWTALASATVVVMAFLISLLLADRMEPQMQHSVWVALAIVPLLAQQRVRQSVMRALHHVVSGHVPEMIVQPALFGTFLGCVFLFYDQPLTAPVATGLRVIAACIALAAIFVMCRRIVPPDAYRDGPVYRDGPWFRAGLTMMWGNGLSVFITNIGTIMVGFLAGAASAGIYSLVSLMSNLIMFAVASINAPLAPSMSRLYVRDELPGMQRLATKAARAALLAALAMTAVFAIAGEWALGLIHPRFAAGYETLLILCAGQIALSTLGSVGVILVTIGDQRVTAIARTVSAVVTVSLCFLLIPIWGINGAAVAAICGPLATKTYNTVRVYRRLGLNTTALGAIA